MRGPEILARSLSVPSVINKKDNTLWQYHSRSDDHSKKSCWLVVFDLIQHCPLLKMHIDSGKVYFGINHQMRDFQQNRKKDLDLVLCTKSASGKVPDETFADKADDYGLVLNSAEKATLESMPTLRRAPVGSVLIALEAKACMTEHGKARPRLYDELNSSHLTVHGATDEAIAGALVMINRADSFISPGKAYDPSMGREPNLHNQPKVTRDVIEKVSELPRRSHTGRAGFDAIGIVIIDCKNDGSPVSLVTGEPAPQPGDSFHYDTMIHRLAQLYSTRFSQI